MSAMPDPAAARDVTGHVHAPTGARRHRRQAPLVLAAAPVDEVAALLRRTPDAALVEPIGG
jgi:hypothetical protein